MGATFFKLMMTFIQPLLAWILSGHLFFATLTLAQVDVSGRPDAQLILNTIPQQCRTDCNAISDAVGGCPDLDCLCTESVNGFLFDCTNCLYKEEVVQEIYDASQDALEEFALVCNDYPVQTRTMATRVPASTTAISSSSATSSRSSTASITSTTVSSPSSTPTSESLTTRSETTSGSPTTTPAPTSSTRDDQSPAPTPDDSPLKMDQKCYLVRPPRQRVLSARSFSLSRALNYFKRG